MAVAWLGTFGPVADTEVLGWAIMLDIPAGGLVASMALARWACRKQYSLGRFMLWLLVGMVVACPVLVVAAVTTMALAQESLLALVLILPALIGSVFVAGMLYVFNLPYMLLVQRVGLYRARFHAVLSLPLAPPDDLIQLEVVNELTFERRPHSAVWSLVRLLSGATPVAVECVQVAFLSFVAGHAYSSSSLSTTGNSTTTRVP